VLNLRQQIVGMMSERDLLHFQPIEDTRLTYIRGKTVADVMPAEVVTGPAAVLSWRTQRDTPFIGTGRTRGSAAPLSSHVYAHAPRPP
jgi:hypothetical protein